MPLGLASFKFNYFQVSKVLGSHTTPKYLVSVERLFGYLDPNKVEILALFIVTSFGLVALQLAILVMFVPLERHNTSSCNYLAPIRGCNLTLASQLINPASDHS